MSIHADHRKAIAALDSCPDVKVLRRFEPRHAYGIVDDKKIGLYVDVETTGLNTDLDQVIQFAAVRFEFDAAGHLGHVGPMYCGLEDPGFPLEKEITEITGITDELLKGKKLDTAKIAELQQDAVLAIAHNADFDRKMTEARLPGFDKIAWACSQRDVKWDRFGCRGAKLDYLVMMLCQEFYDAHDALNDCLAGIHLLATPTLEGKTPFQLLLESVRTPTYRLFARNSAFQTKKKLSLRRYRWFPEPTKCWAKDLKEDEIEAEREWLRREIYGDRDQSEVRKISAKDRWSVRAA